MNKQKDMKDIMCECSIHGKQEIACIHPRLGIYICAKCDKEWPAPTVKCSYVIDEPSVVLSTISIIKS